MTNIILIFLSPVVIFSLFLSLIIGLSSYLISYVLTIISSILTFVGILLDGIIKEIFYTYKNGNQIKNQTGQTSNNRWIVLIGCFPVTLYIGLGSIICFLGYTLSNWGRGVVRKKLEGTFKDVKSTPEWHKINIWLVLLFPIVGPVILLSGSILSIAGISAFLMSIFLLLANLCKQAMNYLWKLAQDIWKWTVEIVEKVWKWIGEAIETIWQTFSGFFSNS